jgi:hypothetical protein
VPVVHRFPRSARRSRRARQPARELRDRCEVPAATHPHLRRGTRLAAAAAVVLGHQQLYNRDYLGETPEGEQMPMMNVFHRDGETIRHFWGSERMRPVK